MPSLSCSLWDLVPWPGIRCLASGGWSLSHWTTRKSLGGRVGQPLRQGSPRLPLNSISVLFSHQAHIFIWSAPSLRLNISNSPFFHPSRLLLESVSQPLSVQFSSVTQSCPTLCDTVDCSMPGFPVHHWFLELVQTHVHRVGDAINCLILCRPLLLPSIFPSIRVFSNESVLRRRPKYWSFSFSISPSNEYSGLLSFRID